MMPTALSVQSDALIARVHGLACRLARTCSRFLLVLVTAGPIQDRWPRRPARRCAPNRPASTVRAACRPPGGDAGRVVFDGVVKQRGARHVGASDPVMAQDPDRDSQQAAGAEFALPPVLRVQPGGERQRALGAAQIRGGPDPRQGSLRSP
jgi:hypothetical protein